MQLSLVIGGQKKYKGMAMEFGVLKQIKAIIYESVNISALLVRANLS